MAHSNGKRTQLDEEYEMIRDAANFQVSLIPYIIEQARKEADEELRTLAPPSNVRFGNGDMAGRRRLLGSGA
jgi:hypothetical protein